MEQLILKTNVAIDKLGTNEWIYLSAFGTAVVAIGVIVVLIYTIKWIFSGINESNFKLKTTYFGASEGVGKYVEGIDSRIKSVGKTRLSLSKYLVAMVVGFILSIFVGLYIFSNIVVTILMLASVVVILEQIIISLERKRKELLSQQMTAAIRIFVAEFTKNPQIENAIGEVAKQCPPPISNVFGDAYRGLIIGKPRTVVFNEMTSKLNSEHGQMFVQLIKMSDDSEYLVPMFHELESRIILHETLSHENRQQVAGERKLSVAMLLSPIPAYYVVSRLVPETYIFLTNTFFGNLIICLVFVSVIAWAFLSRMTDNIDSI